MPTILKGWKGVGAVLAVSLLLGLAMGWGIGHWGGREAEEAPDPVASVPAADVVMPAGDPFPRDSFIHDSLTEDSAIYQEGAPSGAMQPDPGSAFPAGRDRPSTESLARLPHEPSARPLPSWQRHAIPLADQDQRPMVAIIIDDLGLDVRRTARVMALPGPLTLSFLPYARDLRHQAGIGRAAGHELMLHMPMEPFGDGDPGPGALRVGMAPEIIAGHLEEALGRMEGVVAVNNHMGSRFTSDTEGMNTVMAILARHGLAFVDSRTAASTVAIDVARQHGVMAVSRHVFLDHVDSHEAVLRALSELEAQALKTGMAIGIGHPYDATLDVLEQWIGTLAHKPVRLVPVSAILMAEWQGMAERGTTLHDKAERVERRSFPHRP